MTTFPRVLATVLAVALTAALTLGASATAAEAHGRLSKAKLVQVGHKAAYKTMAANPDIYSWRFGKKYCRLWTRQAGYCDIAYTFTDGTICLTFVVVRKTHAGIRYWEKTGRAGWFDWCP